MNTISRRALFRNVFILAPASALALRTLASCTTAEATVAEDVVADLATWVGTFEAELPAFAAIVGISPATVTEIDGWIDDLVTAAQGVVAGMDQSASEPIAQQISTVFGDLLAALDGFTNLPSVIETLIKAAEALWPVIALGLGFLTSGAEQMRAASSGMTPAEARARLRQLVSDAAAGRFAVITDTRVVRGSGHIVQTVRSLP